jgi:hypothetical protein
LGNWPLPHWPSDVLRQSLCKPLTLRPRRRHSGSETPDFIRKAIPAFDPECLSNRKPTLNYISAGVQNPRLARFNLHVARTQRCAH